jgi:hypothetical protein
MRLFTRKKLLGGLIGLFAAGALLAPVAAAPSPAPVTVTAVEVVDGIYPDSCSIDINVSWTAADLPGPAVNVQLLESNDGGATWTSAGVHVRTDNDGSDYFRRYFAPSTNASFQVRITKGPKHIIASGASATIVCTP